MSYPKDVGFYGNGILSKYPIVSSFSALHPYKHAKGEGNYQWNTGYEYYLYGYDQRSMGYIDILVPTSDSEWCWVRFTVPLNAVTGIGKTWLMTGSDVYKRQALSCPNLKSVQFRKAVRNLCG